MAEVTDVGELPTKRSPGKKDTRKWCKGKVGREHVLETNMQRGPWVGAGCRVPNEWHLRIWPKVLWMCYHQVQCTVCGKILTSWLKWWDCPDLPKELRA